MTADVVFPIFFFSAILFGLPTALYIGVNDLHTVEGRARMWHKRQIGKATARYIRLGLTPADAKAMAEADATKASRELRAALEQTDTETQPAPRLRSVR